ncbi:MAG: hybrid sensor histidine kinase/response regulator [Candidatus Omnitrophota bacterium]
MYKILIVDDGIEIRKLLGAYFAKVGYSTTTLESALLGLDILSKESFDALISDIAMPFMNGVEFAKRAKKLCPNLAVLLLTGYGALDTAQEAIRIGINDYLTKPVDLEKIKDSVDKAIAAMKEKKQRAEYYNQVLYEFKEGKEKLASMQSEFMTLISHELRTPVTVLSDGFSLLKDFAAVPSGENGKTLSEKDKSAIFSGIERSNRRLIKIIEDINYYMDLCRGHIELNMAKVNVKNFLEENFNAFKHVVPENKAILKKDFVAEHALVAIDKDKFSDLLARIIHNAAYHNGEGTEIIIRLREEGKNGHYMAAITISDNGNGIENNTLERIFMPFVAGDLAHHHKGLGLGLAICKKIIDLHNGNITLTSEKEKGTNVVITLCTA